MFENIYQSKYKGKEVDSAIEKVLSNKFATQESLEQINTNKLDKGAKTSELINDGDGNSSFITEKKTSELLEEINNNLMNKVDKEEGKGLSSNDFTNEEKEKLEELYSKKEIDTMLTEKQNTSNELTIVDIFVDVDFECADIYLNGKTQHYYLETINDGLPINIWANNLDKDEFTFYLYLNLSSENPATVDINFYYIDGDSYLLWLDTPTIDYPHTKMLLAFQTIDGGKSWIANQCYSLEVTE